MKLCCPSRSVCLSSHENTESLFRHKNNLSTWQASASVEQLWALITGLAGQHLSCHVIVRNCLSLSMESQGVAAGANLSLVSGWGQGAPWTSRQLIAGPSLMSNVGFSISLKDTSTCSSVFPGARIWTSNLPITSQPALPAELQPSRQRLCTLFYIVHCFLCVQTLRLNAKHELHFSLIISLLLIF